LVGQAASLAMLALDTGKHHQITRSIRLLELEANAPGLLQAARLRWGRADCASDVGTNPP
jgi:hypothetical protein